MNWYWVENNQRQGPVDDEALRALVDSGRIGPETLVWRDGFEGWTAWREVQPPPAAARPAVAAPAAAPVEAEKPAAQPAVEAATDPGATVAISSAALLAQAAAAAPAPAERPAARKPAVETDTCTQCRKIFPRDELMRFEKDRVCAQCKPLYLQRLKEGVQPATQLVYAGFWVRFLAVVIDGVMWQVISYAAGLAIGTSASRRPTMAAWPNGAFDSATCFLTVVLLTLQVGYEVFFIGKYGATLGKMAVKLRVVRPDGSRVSYPRALGRHFAKYLSAIILLVGYIMAAFDEEKRALHDRICDTRVIRV